jgi:hypothetical protein
VLDGAAAAVEQRAQEGVGGRAVQVEPMKRMLKAPGSMLLKTRYDGPLSSFVFNFDLGRYTVEAEAIAANGGKTMVSLQELVDIHANFSVAGVGVSGIKVGLHRLSPF